MLNKQALRHGRGLVEILKIRLRNKLVQIFKPDLVLDKQYHVAGFAVVGGLYLAVDRLDIVHCFCALLGKHGEKTPHYAGDDECIVRGSVMIEVRQAQPV